jgi:hypothetical protein
MQDNKGYTPLMMIAKFYEGEDALKLGKMLVEASEASRETGETVKKSWSRQLTKQASSRTMAPVNFALRNYKV